MTNANGVAVSILSHGTKTLQRRSGRSIIVIDGLHPLEDIARRIRTSSPLEQQTVKLRALLAEGGRKGPYEKAKLAMPAIVPAMQAPKGTDLKGMALLHHNGLYGFDIDEQRESLDLPAVRQSLIEAPGAVMVGTSCAGDALYVILAGPVASDDADYKRHWAALAARLPPAAVAASGPQSKNPNRLRFLAHDPDVWLAPGPVTPLGGAAALVRAPDPAPAPPPRLSKLEENARALEFIPPDPEYNTWIGWLVRLKLLGFSVAQLETWSSTGANYEPGIVAAKWDGLPTPTETEDTAQDILRGTAYKLGWRDRPAATAHTPTYTPPQTAAPTATISIGRTEWQAIGQVCADRLRTAFRYDVELDAFWQFTEGTHWRLVHDTKRLTDPLTDQRLRIAAELKDSNPSASFQLTSGKSWHDSIRSPITEWWTAVRMGLLRPTPAPPDWQLATPGGVIDLRSGDTENHDPLVHDTLAVTRGEYQPDSANVLKDELFEKRLKHNITEEGYDSLLKLLGLAAARKAQELRAILWLLGTSGGGKGMVKNLLLAAFHRRCGGVSLDFLERQHDDIDVALADLLEADPLLVLCDELGGSGIKSRLLLALTGNHQFSARRPHQKVPFTGTFRALWVCPTVTPPRLDTKAGFERRSAVIGFDRKFTGPGGNEDFHPYERDALVTWAVVEAAEVYKPDYTAPSGESAKRGELLESMDTLQHWLDTLPDEWEWTPLPDVSERYGKEHHEKAPSTNLLGRKLTNSEKWESHLPGRGQPKVLKRRGSTPLFGEEG